MTHRLRYDLTPEEVALFTEHMDALQAELNGCRLAAAGLLRGIRADFADVVTEGSAHPLSARVERILASLREIASPAPAPRGRPGHRGIAH
jgi:hypothetical protein